MLDIFKALSTYLVVGHQAPCKDAYLLVKGDLVDAARQVSAVAVNDVLEVLAEADIQGFQVNLTLYDLKQAVKLIDRQIFNDSLRHGGNLFLCRSLRESLVDEVGVDFLKRWMTTVYQVS